MLQQLSFSDPMDDVLELQSVYLRSKPLEDRKALGQFFTGSVVANYMASMLHKPKAKEVRILRFFSYQTPESDYESD